MKESFELSRTFQVSRLAPSSHSTSSNSPQVDTSVDSSSGPSPPWPPSTLFTRRSLALSSPRPRSPLPTSPDSSTLTRSSPLSEKVVKRPTSVSQALPLLSQSIEARFMSRSACLVCLIIIKTLANARIFADAQLGPFTQKKNPLRNKAVLFRLNPYAKTLRRQELLQQERKAKGSVKKSVPAGTAGKEFLDILHAA